MSDTLASFVQHYGSSYPFAGLNEHDGELDFAALPRRIRRHLKPAAPLANVERQNRPDARTGNTERARRIRARRAAVKDARRAAR